MTPGLARVGDSWHGLTVEEPLGRQGMAERYRCLSASGSRVLLDVVGVQHPELSERLRAAGLEQLSHRDLLAVSEVLTVLGFPAVALEDAAGTPLKPWLDQQPPLRERMRVFRSVVEATGYLHGAGHVHGDIEPSTVGVDEAAKRGRLVYTGVAPTVLRLIGGGASVSTAGASPGRRGYTAPELMQNPGALGPATDVFSLGALLYLLLTGRGPFHGLNAVEAFLAARKERYTPVQADAPDAPTGLVDLCDQLLRADPAQRPKDCADILARLDRAGVVSPVTVPEEPRRPGPSRAVVATGVLGALVGILAVWWVLA